LLVARMNFRENLDTFLEALTICKRLEQNESVMFKDSLLERVYDISFPTRLTMEQTLTKLHQELDSFTYNVIRDA
jgi:hypothetical protein